MRVVKVTEGVSMTQISPRLAVIWHQLRGEQTPIMYVGFETQEKAQTFYDWACQQSLKFNYESKSGACKPRPAKRVESPWEVKFHRPPEWLVTRLASKA